MRPGALRWWLSGVVSSAGVVLFLFGTTMGWRVVAPVLLSVVDHSEAGRRCDDWIGQMAAIVQGTSQEHRDRCLGDPLDGARTRVLLSRIARDPDRPEAARIAAYRAMANGRAGVAQEVVDALQDPNETPAFHRRALRSIVLARGGAAWAEDPTRFPGHGMYDIAAIEGAADGLDPGPAAFAWMLMGPDREPRDRTAALQTLGTTTEALRRAVAQAGSGYVPLGMPPEWRTVLARSTCTPGCDEVIGALLDLDARRAREEPPAFAPALAGDDAALDLLYAESGEHVRAEMAAVIDWAIARPADQGERLLGLLASPRADRLDVAETLDEAGDLHAVLRHATGSVGAVAGAAELMGSAAGGARLLIKGEVLYVEVADAQRVVAPCAAPRVGAAPEDAVVLPDRGGTALALRDRAGQALRAGLREDAELFVAEAVARWPDLPGRSPIQAALSGARYAVTRPLDGVGTSPSADATGRTGWKLGDRRLVGIGLSPADAARFEVRGASLRASVSAIQQQTSTTGDLVFASFWAFAFGDAELARLLVPGPQVGPLEDLRMAVLLGVGEPGRAVGPWSRAMTGVEPGPAPCVDASLPWPTMPSPRTRGDR